MSALVKLLGHKLFALAVIVGVGIYLLALPAFTGSLGANPLEKLLHQTGQIAIWLLGAVLALTPLKVLFPKVRIIAALNRHRRYIGVSACIYGLLHLTCHVLYEGDLESVLRSLSKPFIWFGLWGLFFLIILALTSNNWSMRKIGGKNWKRLHRLAYFAGTILFYHQIIAGKGHWRDARWLVIPLATLEIARIIRQRWFKQRGTVSPPAITPA